MAKSTFLTSYCPIISGALLLMGALGLVILSFFGTLIAIDSYSFALAKDISNDKYQKAASCFIAAGYHAVFFILGGAGMIVSMVAKKASH
eukprot:gene8858-807_t